MFEMHIPVVVTIKIEADTAEDAVNMVEAAWAEKPQVLYVDGTDVMYGFDADFRRADVFEIGG